jgi:hypothetical protein
MVAAARAREVAGLAAISIRTAPDGVGSVMRVALWGAVARDGAGVGEEGVRAGRGYCGTELESCCDG